LVICCVLCTDLILLRTSFNCPAIFQQNFFNSNNRVAAAKVSE
jgi:hypothetical protein